MAEVNPELQERLEELDRELEVCKLPLDCSPNSYLCPNYWLGRLGKPLELVSRSLVDVACDQKPSSRYIMANFEFSAGRRYYTEGASNSATQALTFTVQTNAPKATRSDELSSSLNSSVPLHLKLLLSPNLSLVYAYTLLMTRPILQAMVTAPLHMPLSVPAAARSPIHQTHLYTVHILAMPRPQNHRDLRRSRHRPRFCDREAPWLRDQRLPTETPSSSPPRTSLSLKPEQVP